MATAKTTDHVLHHRTLNSLRGLAAAQRGVKRSDTYRMEPLLLQVEPDFNKRILSDPELRDHIDSIKQSIRDAITKDDPENRFIEKIPSDIIPDLIVRVTETGEVFLVDGHCRTCAIRELIEEGFIIQYVGVTSTGADRIGRTVIMLRTAQGKELAPIEKAMGYLEMADEGLSFPQISRMLGGKKVSPQRVEQLVLLARAPLRVRQLVEEKKLTADSAIEVLRKFRDNPAEAERILVATVEHKAGNGDRPVGKGLIRPSMPKKAQEGIFKAIVSESKVLTKQIKALETTGGDGWEEELVNVTLPAGVVKQILEQQANAQAAQGNAGEDA